MLQKPGESFVLPLCSPSAAPLCRGTNYRDGTSCGQPSPRNSPGMRALGMQEDRAEGCAVASSPASVKPRAGMCSRKAKPYYRQQIINVGAISPSLSTSFSPGVPVTSAGGTQALLFHPGTVLGKESCIRTSGLSPRTPGLTQLPILAPAMPAAVWDTVPAQLGADGAREEFRS